MPKYKLTEGEARLLVAVFDHLKPYYEQAKARHTSVADEMSTKTIIETYYGLLARALAAKLDASERTIIKKRYGLLNSGKCYTLKELAQEFNVTYEPIRQVEAEALKKIKQYMTELNDEETAAAISLLDAKAQEHLGHAIGAKVQDDATSGDVYMYKWMVHTNAIDKLKIQQKMRKFKEQQ